MYQIHDTYKNLEYSMYQISEIVKVIEYPKYRTSIISAVFRYPKYGMLNILKHLNALYRKLPKIPNVFEYL